MYKLMNTGAKAEKVKQIEKHIVQLGSIPGNIISYTEVSSMIQILGDVIDNLNHQIEAENSR